jgi:hypothetical protein
MTSAGHHIRIKLLQEENSYIKSLDIILESNFYERKIHISSTLDIILESNFYERNIHISSTLDIILEYIFYDG